MPQRLYDARVSIAHRREVAARAHIRHRKLRPRQVLQNRPEDDERPRVVEPAVRGIGDNADHFDVTTLGSGEPDVPADGVACREQRAREGRRDQRNGGLPRAVVPRDITALQPRQPEQIEEAGRHALRQHRDFRCGDAVGPRVVLRRERPRDPKIRRVIHRERGRLGPRHVAKVGRRASGSTPAVTAHDLRARDTRG